MNRYLEEVDIPKWINNQRKDHHDPEKLSQTGTAPNNYKPITCLLIMLKILTAQIKEIYYSLISRGLFPKGQMECHKGTRGTGELLYIDTK